MNKSNVIENPDRDDTQIAADAIISPDAKIERGVRIGVRVVFAGPNILVGRDAVIEPASVIGKDVTIGQGALIRAGAVVLSSVPPNAIVEGNPGQVVGYVEGDNVTRRQANFIINETVFTGENAPSRYPLGVGEAALHLMRKVTDTRGSLSVGEVESELPFRPERYFFVYDVPSTELRGEHAHRECQQFLICTHGSCRVMLDDGGGRCEVLLDRPELGVFMPPMIWGTQYKYSPDAVLLVFASLPYDSSDYLRSYDEFLAEVRRRGA